MTQNMRGTLQSPTTITADEQGNLPQEIKLLPVGTFNTISYGPLEITDGLCQEFVANFQRGARNGLPIDLDHDKGAAAGWVTRLIHRAGDGLYGIVDWTKIGTEALTNRIYRFFSSEFTFGYEDPATGRPLGNVFIGGGLTNRPLFQELPALVAHETNDPTQRVIVLTQEGASMELASLRTKSPADLTDEEKNFLAEHRAELTDDEQTTFGLVETPPVEPGNQPPTPPAPQEPTPSAEPNPAPVEAHENKTVNISASELAALKSRADMGMQAKIQLDKMAIGKEIEGMTFSASNKDGVFLPKSASKLEAFVYTLNESQRTAFKDIIAELPKGTTHLFNEIGTGEQSPVGTESSDRLNSLAEGKVQAAFKDGRTLTFSQALQEVAREHPELTNESYRSTRKDL